MATSATESPLRGVLQKVEEPKEDKTIKFKFPEPEKMRNDVDLCRVTALPSFHFAQCCLGLFAPDQRRFFQLGSFRLHEAYRPCEFEY